MPSRTSYAKGRAKREEILAIALKSLATGGGTTLADIAEAAGVTRSTLLYHFNSREELFAEVVRWRDELDKQQDPPEGLLPGYIELARRNAEIPGVVHLFTTLSAEATTPGHAAHDYFQNRYSTLLEKLAGEIRSAQALGTVTADADPLVLARIYVAVMDGLQLQWLYDDSADMPGAMSTVFALFSGRAAD